MFHSPLTISTFGHIKQKTPLVYLLTPREARKNAHPTEISRSSLPSLISLAGSFLSYIK